MNKENLPSGSGTLSPDSASDKTADYNEQNECSVCMGKYDNDFVDDELQAEWIAALIVENRCMKTVSLLNKKLMCVFSVTVSSNSI